MYIKTDFTEFLSLKCEVSFPFSYEISPTFLELSTNMQGIFIPLPYHFAKRTVEFT